MRPRKTRKIRKVRKQRGGSLEELFPSISFTLQAASAEAGKKVNTMPVKANLTTWSAEEKSLFNKKHLLTMYERKENGAKVRLCTLYFIPSFEETGIGYLDNLDCYTKTDTFRPVSYLIVYKFLEILNSLDISFVFFSVAAMGDKYYRLFELYHSMGFVCKPDVANLNGNTTELLRRYKAQQVNNEGFFTGLPTRNLAHANTAKNVFLRCSEMYGHVPSVLAKIESQLPQ